MENKKIAIITDSSSGLKTGDMPDLYVIPLIVTVNNLNETSPEKRITIYHDGVDCDNAKIIELQKNANIQIKTSQASVGEAMQLVEQIYENYDEIYVLPITSSVSGSENSWQLVAEDYPKLKVLSQHMGGPMLQFMLEDIMEMKNNGSLNELSIKAYLKEVKAKIFGMLMVWDPRKVAKGGRVKNFVGAALNLFNIKLSISLDENGMKMYKTFSSIKSGAKRCFTYFANKCKEFSVDNIKKIMFIRNSKETKAQDIDNLITEVKNKLGNIKCKVFDNIIMPSVLVSHTGADALIVALEMK